MRSTPFACVYACRMDVLADVLGSVRGQGSLLFQTLNEPPWATHYRPSPPLTLHAFVRGGGWVAADGAEPVRLARRELAVVRGPGPHRVADALGTPAHLVIEGTARCSHAAGPEAVRLGPRTYGRDKRQADTVLLSGTYPLDGQIGTLLLDTLPPVVHVPADPTSTALLDALAHEIPVDGPGQETVLDRLLDTLLIRTLRTWLADRTTCRPALHDPPTATALRLLHEHPAAPWTVTALATAAGVSRATLARRFTRHLGHPPLTYLTHWRMTLAARMLHDPALTIAEIARRVGYTDPFAFTTAFKRAHGTPPSAWRTPPRRT